MKYIWMILPILALACSSTPKKVSSSRPTSSAQAKLEEAIQAMERSDFGSAAEIFDKMLMQKPASEFDLIIIYNDGVAHENLNECKRAAELYRKAISGASALRIPRVEAESYYRLSLAYECLGDDQKTIVSLLDTRKRAKNLAPELSAAELPARLATAYARIGQRDKALQYFKEAGNGLKVALTQAGTTSRIQQAFAARILYAMGTLTPIQKGLNGDPKSFLSALAMQQPYLLQSAELNVAPDSRKAADELIFAYENLLKMKPADMLGRRQFLQIALQDIAEIKKIRLPNKGPLVDEIYDKIDEQESRIRQQLVTVSDTTPLTPEAQSREGLKRQGRVVSPGNSTKQKSKVE
jgi:tetratricopeptide (TPR) repeat protein